MAGENRTGRSGDDKPMHGGHRARLKEQFLDHGLDTFSDHQTLELLLAYAIPRRDTNPIAHALMDHFGTLSAVFEASDRDLMEVEGVGEHAAALIRLVTELGRRYQIDKARFDTVLSGTAEMGRYVSPLFYGLPDEAVFMVCLDGKLKVTHCQRVADGSVNSIHFSIRRVTELALKRKAVHLVLAHNHPSGVAIPSVADIETTERLAKSLSAVGIRLADHIIVADGDFVSLRDSGHLDALERR